MRSPVILAILGCYCFSQVSAFSIIRRGNTGGVYTTACRTRNANGLRFWGDGGQAAIATAALQASSKITDGTGLARKIALEQRLGMTDSEIAKLVPSEYTTENIISKVDWLQQRLQLDQKELRKIVSKNSLASTTERLESRINWYQERFRWSDKDLAKALAKAGLLNLSIEDNVEPKANWFCTVFNATDAELSKMINAYPNMFNLGESNLEETVEWLVETLQLDSTTSHQGKRLFKAARILQLSKENLNSKFVWLQESLHLTKSETAKVFQKQPMLFTYSIENNMQPSLAWFCDSFGHQRAKKMIQKIPHLLCCRIPDTIKPKMEFLQKRLQLGDKELADLVSAQPGLLTVNVENLEPKIQFFTECVGDRALPMLVSNPVMLTVSLEQRLIPRWEQAEKLGLEAETHLRKIVFLTNEQWERFAKVEQAKETLTKHN